MLLYHFYYLNHLTEQKQNFLASPFSSLRHSLAYLFLEAIIFQSHSIQSQKKLNKIIRLSKNLSNILLFGISPINWYFERRFYPLQR